MSGSKSMRSNMIVYYLRYKEFIKYRNNERAYECYYHGLYNRDRIIVHFKMNHKELYNDAVNYYLNYTKIKEEN